MSSKILYRNKTPLKALYIIEILFGGLLLCFFILLYITEFFLDIWTFAGPLLGLALLIAGFSSSKIKEIILDAEKDSVVINIESLLKTKSTNIDNTKFDVQLKSPTGTKKKLFPLLRLILLENQKEIAELKSGFMSYNNRSLRKLYAELKNIVNK